MRFRGTLIGLILVAIAGQARAQQKEKEERPTGLPKKVEWTFNFDAGLGAFGFNYSLYTDVRPDPSGDLSDNWFESYVKLISLHKGGPAKITLAMEDDASPMRTK